MACATLTSIATLQRMLIVSSRVRPEHWSMAAKASAINCDMADTDWEGAAGACAAVRNRGDTARGTIRANE